MTLKARADRVAEMVGQLAIDDNTADWAELLLIEVQHLFTQPRRNVGAKVELIGRRMMDT